MNQTDAALNVLQLFASYGFRKVSMGDIAEAAGLSRQSIYNQHGSKEAVLDWATGQMLDRVTAEAVSCLRDSAFQPPDALSRAFQAWIGAHVPLLRGTPHGAELLDNAIAAAAKATRNYEQDFLKAVSAFLLDRGCFQTPQAAQDTAYVLHLAAKGLLLKSDTQEEFAQGMRRVIQSVIR